MPIALILLHLLIKVPGKLTEDRSSLCALEPAWFNMELWNDTAPSSLIILGMNKRVEDYLPLSSSLLSNWKTKQNDNQKNVSSMGIAFVKIGGIEFSLTWVQEALDILLNI